MSDAHTGCGAVGSALQAGNVRGEPCNAAKVLTTYALFCCHPGPLSTCGRTISRSCDYGQKSTKSWSHRTRTICLLSYKTPTTYERLCWPACICAQSTFRQACQLCVHRDAQVLVADIDLEPGALEALALGFQQRCSAVAPASLGG
jgi:hypothetical protein